MSATNFLVAASAGTGKTFALSSHVLRLLLLGEAPEAVLALTFSRLAAAEIFDRVVGRLAAATESDAEAAKLSGELAEGEGGEPVRARFPGGVPRAEFLRVLRVFKNMISDGSAVAAVFVRSLPDGVFVPPPVQIDDLLILHIHASLSRMMRYLTPINAFPGKSLRRRRFFITKKRADCLRALK